MLLLFHWVLGAPSAGTLVVEFIAQHVIEVQRPLNNPACVGDESALAHCRGVFGNRTQHP